MATSVTVTTFNNGNETETTVFNRFFGGKDRGMVVKVCVTRDEFEEFRSHRCEVSNFEFDVATVATVFDRWVEEGCEVEFTTAAEFNEAARAMENHRFADTVDFSTSTAEARRRANDSRFNW